MLWKKLAVCVGMTLIAHVATAQVHRCKDASGKIAYSDAPCNGVQTGEQIQRARTREEMLEERLRVAEANERSSNARAERAERYSDNRAPRERTVIIHSQNNAPDKSTSSGCISAKKELDFVSSIQTLSREAKRDRMNAASTNVHVSCR